MMRVCPDMDALCPNGIECNKPCATGRWGVETAEAKAAPDNPHERLAQYVKGVSPYRAWRGEAPEGEPTLKRDIEAMLAAAPKAEPVEADDFGDALLAFLFRHGLKVALDVSEIEALRQSAIRAQPEAPKVEQEPVAWLVTGKASGTKALSFTKLADLPFNRSRFDVEPLYTHPAPASDELSKAASLVSRLLANSIAHYGNPKDEDFGVGATHKEARDFLTKRAPSDE